MRLQLWPAAAARTRTLICCYALCGITFLAAVILNTVLPFRLLELGGSKTQVGLLFSVVTLVAMALRPVAGGWVDRFGARPVLWPGIAILAGVSLALHVAPDPRVAIVLMAGVGLANALITTTSSVLTARAADAAHRGETLSLYYLASSLGIALAPPVALALRAAGGVPLAFAAVTGLAVVLLLLALALPRPLTAPVGGARPGVRPFSRHAIDVGAVVALTTMGHYSIYAFLPLYASGGGQGAAVVWFFGTYSTCLIGGRAVFGALSDRWGRLPTALLATMLTAGGYTTLVLPPAPASLILAAALLGSGAAVLFPTLTALLLDRAPDTERGLALGSLRSAWDLGATVGSALLGVVADRVSFPAAFALAGATAVLGAVTLGLIAYRRRPDPAAGPAPPPSPGPASS